MARGYRRRKNLIDPKFQLMVGGIFVATLVIGLGLYSALVMDGLTGLFADAGVASATLSEGVANVFVSRLLIVLGLCTALTMALAIVVTFRVSGPAYRMKQFLEQVKNGENPEPCHLRKGDILQDLCALINEVTEPLRAGEAPTPDADVAESRREREPTPSAAE